MRLSQCLYGCIQFLIDLNSPSMSFHVRVLGVLTVGLGVAIAGPLESYAQWIEEGSVLHTGDKVGVGTRYPSTKLEVHENNGSTGNHYLLELQRNTGLGETYARGTGLLYTDANSVQAGLVADRLQSALDYRSDLVFLVNGNRSGFNPSVSLTERMRLTSRGYLGIGTSKPNERLTVNGKILAEEVKVQLSEDWPDYVFEEDYNLPSLEAAEAYIQQHGHLEGVPSAEDVKKNGHQVGQTQRALLRKVEELTLYIIEQEKRIRALEANTCRTDEREDKSAPASNHK